MVIYLARRLCDTYRLRRTCEAGAFNIAMLCTSVAAYLDDLNTMGIFSADIPHAVLSIADFSHDASETKITPQNLQQPCLMA